MNKKKLIIFDLDGTLADTSPGIINCHKYAHASMNKSVPSDEVLFNVIGGPLLDTYVKVFRFEEAEAKQAVANYRERYAEKGVYEVSLYPSLKRVLASLRKKGYLLGVATLKAEYLAKKLLTHFEVADYFDVIKGVDVGDKLTKSDLLNLVIKNCNVTNEDAVLVGDSIFDYNGAQEVGISFVAATYGFGFKGNELKSLKVDGTIKAFKDLDILFK